MSTVGQAAGMVVGGVAGSFVGMPMLGASIGGAIGGYIDPPKGQDSIGPRLEDLTVQTSTYGAVLPRIKGTVAVTGNVFWLEGDKLNEHKNTKKVGGKGGPTAKQTTFSYTVTFAVGLSHQISAPIAGIRRLWLANTLVYDAGSGDLNSIIASNQMAGVMFKFYDGSDDQQPDPRMQADKGVANVSGYPGRCYIVFYDLDLTEKYNNTLMATQVKVELVCGTAGGPSHYPLFTAPDLGTERKVVSATVSQESIKYAVARYRSWDGQFEGVDYYESRFGEYLKLTSSMDHLIGVTYGRTGVGLLFISNNLDGGLHVIVQQGNFLNSKTQIIFISDGSVLESSWYSTGDFAYGYYDIAACDHGYSFLGDTRAALPIVRFEGAVLAATSSVSVRANCIALSETRVFIANYTGVTNSTTVTVLARSDLSLVANYTQSVNGYHGVLHVVSDTEFYLVAGDDLSHWVDGVAENLGAVCHSPTGGYPFRWAAIYNDPDYFVQFDPSSGSGYELSGFITNFPISAQVAKLRDVVTEECALAGISSSDLDLTELVNSDVRGYRVSQAGSVRSVLEQLQAAFPFDVIQSGYKLKFKSRGGASVIAVPESDLGAHTGNETPSRFMLTTEMPSQVPAKVTFNFLNADREYDPDEQSAAFTAQDVKNSYTVSLPLVMTPTEALRAADVLLKKEQRERTSAGTFWLPPSDDYRKLEAADVIDVVAQGRTHTIRLTKVTQLPDGRVECDGKLTASSAYASVAQAQNSLALGQTLVPMAGSSELILLDIPRIVSDQDVPGVALGMYGYTGTWPGGIALRSDDSGETYGAICSFSSKTEAFTAGNSLSAANSYAIDNASELVVTPAWTGADLFSLTEPQLYAHGNLAAYGAAGRWEIVAFRSVTASGSGYVIRDFRRALFGTEWASSLHTAGDHLIMLDLETTDFAGLPLTAINSPRLWRGVTAGAALDSAADVSNTYGAVNLMPLAPVDLRGDRVKTSRDWNIACSPRSRWPVEVFSGVAQPLGESPEAYVVEVFDATYTTLKRTFSAPSPAVTYTYAQQVADFGFEQPTIYLKWRMVSSVVGAGYPLIGSLSQVLSDDPHADYLTLGLHFNGTNGSTVFTDVRGNTVTAFGNAQISTAASQWGGAAGLFDGTGDYLTIPGSTVALSNKEFYIRGYARISASGALKMILDGRGLAGDLTSVIVLYIGADSKVYFKAGTASAGASGSWDVILTSTTALSTGAFYYIEVSRVGNTFRLFVAGNVESSQTMSMTIGTPATTAYIGSGCNGAGTLGYGFNGYLDDWSVHVGAAGNTSNYTPPTGEFPNP